MDRAMRMEKAPAEGNQLLEGSLSANISVADPNLGSVSVPVSGSFTAVGNSSAVEMDMKMSLDMSSIQEAAGIDDATAAILKDLQFDMIADAETGVYYMRLGTLMDLLLGMNLQGTGGMEGTNLSGLKDTWFKLDVNAMMEQFGAGLPDLDSAELMQNPSVGGILTETLRMIPLTDKDEDWNAIQAVTNMFSALLSDKAFVKEGDNYVCTYALTMPVDSQSMAINYKLTLAMTGEEVTGIALTASLEMGTDKVSVDVSGDSKTAHVDMSLTAGDVSMTVKVDSTESAINMDMSLNAEEMVSMDYHLEGTVTATDKTPATQPPADAQVIDMNGQIFAVMPIAA